MTNRAPTTVWGVGMPPNMRAYVRTSDDDCIEISAKNPWDDGDWEWLVVDRQTARMIARRINECLDATAKR